MHELSGQHSCPSAISYGRAADPLLSPSLLRDPSLHGYLTPADPRWANDRDERGARHRTMISIMRAQDVALCWKGDNGHGGRPH